MRNYASVISVFFLLLISCNETKEDKKALLPDSSGAVNHILVLSDGDLWNGMVGETIREHFAATVDALPQEEPLFSLNQMPVESFNGFVKRQRTFLFIQKGEEKQFKLTTDLFARNQRGAFISGKNNQEIMEMINLHADSIIKEFRQMEIKERQRQLAVGAMLDTKSLEDSLKVSLKIPAFYRIAKLTDDFAWLRRDIRSGDLNLLIYQMPLGHFDNEETRMEDIIKMRDSIGKMHIPGPNEGSYMITEQAFSPYLFQSEVNGKFAYEVKGTWEVYNFFMAGPFINYIIRDEANNRLLIIEGFTFAPSVNKRDYQFELEAIIKGAKIL